MAIFISEQTRLQIEHDQSANNPYKVGDLVTCPSSGRKVTISGIWGAHWVWTSHGDGYGRFFRTSQLRKPKEVPPAVPKKGEGTSAPKVAPKPKRTLPASLVEYMKSLTTMDILQRVISERSYPPIPEGLSFGLAKMRVMNLLKKEWKDA